MISGGFHTIDDGRPAIPLLGDVRQAFALESCDYVHRLETRTCFENAIRQSPEPLGATWVTIDVSGFNILRGVSPLTTWDLPAKNLQRVAGGARILLDVAKESADWFPPLKSALGGVSALIKHYEVLVECMTIVHS